MKKILTSDQLHVINASEFERSFRDYLKYLQSRNSTLHFKLTSNYDLDVDVQNLFFREFFSQWLSTTYDYHQELGFESVKKLHSVVSLIDDNFDQLMIYSSVLRMIDNSSFTGTLHFFDITTNSAAQLDVLRYLQEHPEPVLRSKFLQLIPVSASDFEDLENRGFLVMNDDMITGLSYKGKRAYPFKG